MAKDVVVSLNKVEELPYHLKRGDIVIIYKSFSNEWEPYLVSQVNPGGVENVNKFKLVSLRDGNRWTDELFGDNCVASDVINNSRVNIKPYVFKVLKSNEFVITVKEY